MKTITLGFYLLWAIFLTGCDQTVSISKLKQAIKTQISHTPPQLAVMDAVYIAEYTNFKDNWIHDDIYIRKDSARRAFGFDLQDVTKKFDIKENNGIRVLTINLPEPKALEGRHTNVMYALSKEPNYTPKDEKGNDVDIDKVLAGKLDEQEKLLASSLKKEAKEHAKHYFDMLAKTFGLDHAEVTFSGS